MRREPPPVGSDAHAARPDIVAFTLRRLAPHRTPCACSGGCGGGVTQAVRARLSADGAPEGKMLAVISDEATARAAIASEEKVWMAVLNARGRQVLAGEVEAV